MPTTDQQTSLEKPVCRTVYFVELSFASGVARASTAGNNFTWGGYDWIGLGGIGGISAVEESIGLASSKVDFTLNAAQSSLRALAVGPVEDYRGRSSKLYFCALDEQFRMIDTPELCWRGIMDTMTLGVDGESGRIALKCETSAYGLKRRPSLRLNAAQQKKQYPADTGFDYLTDLLAQPQLWLSKRFQQI